MFGKLKPTEVEPIYFSLIIRTLTHDSLPAIVCNSLHCFLFVFSIFFYTLRVCIGTLLVFICTLNALIFLTSFTPYFE